MAITTVNVPVPLSGDGPAVSVAGLVGPLTIQLSGNFVGYYDLLANQNGGGFVPIASFSAGGLAGIEVSIDGTFGQVKLRANVTSATGVVCNVSGTTAQTGENGFGTIASVGTGFSGLSPIVDTSGFIPPNGSEKHTSFLCLGAVQGLVTVLGSLDGVEFNPVGSFRVDRLPEGAPLVSELPALLTDAKFRYVRLDFSGTTLGPVVVTMGGSVPQSGSAPVVSSKVGISSDGSTQGFFVNGQTSAAPFSDDAGNVVTPSGTVDDLLCLGDNNVLNYSSGPVVVLGARNHTTGGALQVAVGVSNNLTSSATHVFGTGNNALGGSLQVLVGQALVALNGQRLYLFGQGSQAVGADQIVVIGSFINVTPAGLSSSLAKVTAIGWNHGLGGNCESAVIIGTSITSQAFHTVGIGTSLSIGASDQSVIMGDTISLGTGNQANVVIGRSLTRGDANSSCVQIGDISSLGNGSDVVVQIGREANVGSSSGRTNSIGFQCSIGDSCPNSTLIGTTSSIASGSTVIFAGGTNVNVGSNSLNVVALGATLSLSGPSQQHVAVVGDTITILGAAPNGTRTQNIVALGSTHAIGNTDVSTERAVVIGANLQLGNAANNQMADIILMGSSNTITDPAPAAPTASVICLGDNNTITGPLVTDAFVLGSTISITSIGSIVAIGDSITASSASGTAQMICIGSNITSTAAGLSIIIGMNASAGLDSQCIAIGPGVSIAANSRGIAIGPGATTTSDTHHWAIALGLNASAGNDEFIVGKSNTAGDPDSSIHHFQIQGYNGGNLNTIDAIDNPAAGDTGLMIVYNTAGVFSNKTVHASASPPAGALLLYIDP